MALVAVMPNDPIQSRPTDDGQEDACHSPRFSTIAAMDRIVVIVDGQIVEVGTHEALMGEGRFYAKLWMRHPDSLLAPKLPGTDAAA